MMRPGAEDILGNARVLEALRRIAGSESLGHAYLFHGPDGVGKKLAALAFARAINCMCEHDSDRCESCGLIDSLSHPEVLLLEDLNKPRWIHRRDMIDGGGGDADRGYREAIGSLAEHDYLEEPLPRLDVDVAIDGLYIKTDELFGKGSVPSRECYTPKPVSEKIRKQYDGGDVSEAEYRLLKRLYEYPLSVMPYRGAIPIAYVTTRKGWKFVRPIQQFLSVATMLGGKKIVIVDDAHKMTQEAQNCLLKTLEEPPHDSVLILITSDRHLLFPTIVSRCQVVNFSRLTGDEMEIAYERLVGDGDGHKGMLVMLSENCPGRLLELGVKDVEGLMAGIKDFFNELAEGHLACVFTFSRAVLGEGRSHRRKVRERVRYAMELVVFWINQVLRVKHGVTGAIEDEDLTRSLAKHARHFGQAELLEATHQIEERFALTRFNVDMSLLLQTTLFRLAQAITPGVHPRGQS
jgi:DNA polymerase-3 subunit delta'